MALVIHVVPQLPPVISGVGDYAVLVGSKMEELQPELRCCYIACGSQSAEDPEGPGRRNATGSRDPARLWRAVQELSEESGCDGELALVIHYSGYGYDSTGAPRWLAEVLDRRPQQFAAVQIVTMFHELYATSWPWRRGFWYSPRQRAVARRIAQISHGLMSNREQSAQWLEHVTHRRRDSVPSLAVPSNVGEPERLPSWHQKLPRAITFGGATVKNFALTTRASAAAKMLAELGIEELIDIGDRAPIDMPAFRARGIHVEQLGTCGRQHVGHLLLNSRIGLVDYPYSFVQKSSIVASFAAHGLAIFLNREPRCGPLTGLPVCSLQRAARSGPPTEIALARAAMQARDWYLPHRSDAHARLLIEMTAPQYNGKS